MTNKERYSKWVEQQEYVPIMMTPWWLDAVCVECALCRGRAGRDLGRYALLIAQTSLAEVHRHAATGAGHNHRNTIFRHHLQSNTCNDGILTWLMELIVMTLNGISIKLGKNMTYALYIMHFLYNNSL